MANPFTTKASLPTQIKLEADRVWNLPMEDPSSEDSDPPLLSKEIVREAVWSLVRTDKDAALVLAQLRRRLGDAHYMELIQRLVTEVMHDEFRGDHPDWRDEDKRREVIIADWPYGMSE